MALAGTQRDIQIKAALERDVRLVRFEQGVLEFSLAPGGSPHLAAQLMRKLQDWTGQRWMVALSTAPGRETLVEQAETKEKERRIGVQAHPLVRATLDQFPGAVIVAVRGGEMEPVGAPDAKTPAGRLTTWPLSTNLKTRISDGYHGLDEKGRRDAGQDG